MDRVGGVLSRGRALFCRKQLDEDLDQELRAHIEFAIEENLKRGLSRQEARSAALRAFGGVTQFKERYRVQRGVPLLEELGRDLRFGVRQLCRNPGFTFIAVMVLGLGIAVTTAIFAFVDVARVLPLPYRDPSRL